MNMCMRREWPGERETTPGDGLLKSSNEISCFERSFFKISSANLATCHCVCVCVCERE